MLLWKKIILFLDVAFTEACMLGQASFKFFPDGWKIGFVKLENGH